MELKDNYKEIKFEDLSKKHIEFLENIWVLNWYWWAWSNWLIRKLIWFVTRKFKKANSQKHDYWYWVAVTSRKECDEKFFKAMIDDMIDIYDENSKKLELVLNLIICLASYWLIRIVGWKYYNK